MIRRLLESVAWLAVGHAASAGLFWAFLQVPESNALMLAASAVLLALVVLVAAWTQAFVVLGWMMPGSELVARARRALAALPVVLAGAVVFLAIWWPAARLLTEHLAHRGEIDAWILLHLGAARTAWLHGFADWLMWMLQYPLAISIAGSLVVRYLARRIPATVHERWWRAALSPTRIGYIAAALFALVWLPWQAVYWHPASLTLSLEPVFAALKLALLYVLANTGWALVLRSTLPADGPPPAEAAMPAPVAAEGGRPA